MTAGSDGHPARTNSGGAKLNNKGGKEREGKEKPAVPSTRGR